MTAHDGAMPAEMSAELLCHRCGYDLRAHPPDGSCPECGASVAEARQWAEFPRRPAWRDCDPRWRRHMLAGTWILVLLPVIYALSLYGPSVPVPTFFNYPGGLQTLSNTFISHQYVYQPLIFCIGIVLLFSKERGRRRGQLDWTRRWGVACSYIVLLLSIVPVLFLGSLVLGGISALFQSMPLKYQPRLTYLFVELSTGYLRYGPHPKAASDLALVAFSSIAILLACVRLYEALSSTGPKRLAAILLAPLALFSLILLAQISRYCFGNLTVTMSSRDILNYEQYFCPQVLLRGISALLAGVNLSILGLSDTFVEAVKWCVILAVAIWLSIAHLAARRGKKMSSAPMLRPDQKTPK